MDPKHLQRDLVRIERRLGELDVQRKGTRDIEAEALSILRRPKPKEDNTMAGNYFVGADGRRRDFDASGRELASQDGATARPNTLRRPLSGDTPAPALNLNRPNLAAGIPTVNSGAAPPQGPRPGDTNTFTGRDGQTRRVDVQATPADAATPYGIPSLARPQPGQRTPALNLSRPTPHLPGAQPSQHSAPRLTRNPVTTATRVPFDEAVRRAEMAMGSYRVRSPAANTRSQMQRHYDAAAAMRDFWLDQARSVPGAAQRMAEQQAELGSAERIAGTEATAAMQRTQAENDSRLQGIQMQERGAMDRTEVKGQLDLRRPQKPITLADGTLAQIGPDGTLQPYTMPDGSMARGLQRPQVDQGALARLTTDLTPQFLGADSYGMVPDANAEDGVRYPTQEERLAAFRQASAAARETLSGSTVSDPPRQQQRQASTQSTGARPASQDEFLERARAANPGYSDAELIQFYSRTYGAR